MGSASTELGPVLGLDVPSTGVAGTAEGNGWSVESLLDQAAAAAHKHHEPSTTPQQTGLDGGPVSYSWSLHLPLPLPMFYRLYGASEGKDLLAKAKTRIPPVPGTPFDLILGVTVRVCEPDSPSFPPLPPLSSSLVPACLTPCPFTAPHRATDSILHPAFLHSLTKCHVLGVDLRHEEGSSGVLGGGAPVTTSLLCLHPMHDGYDILLVPESCLTFSILWGHLRHELWGAPSFNAFLVLGPRLLTKPMVTRTPPPLPDGLLPTPQPQEVWGDLEPRRENSPTQEGEGEAWQHDRYSPHDDDHRTDQPRDHRRQDRRGRDSYVVGEKRGRDERRAYSPPHDKTREPLIKFNESRAARDSCVFARDCIRHQSGRCPAKLHPGDPGYVHPSRVLCGFGRSCVHLRKGQCKHVHLEPPLDEDYD